MDCNDCNVHSKTSIMHMILKGLEEKWANPKSNTGNHPQFIEIHKKLGVHNPLQKLKNNLIS